MSKKIIILINGVFLFFHIGCSLKENKETILNDIKYVENDYIQDNSLTSKDHIEYESFIPEKGFIENPEIATQIAELIWSSIYGKKWIEDQKPFHINLENDVWIIKGHLEEDIKGGTAYIELRKSDGKILKMYHGK